MSGTPKTVNVQLDFVEGNSFFTFPPMVNPNDWWDYEDMDTLVQKITELLPSGSKVNVSYVRRGS